MIKISFMDIHSQTSQPLGHTRIVRQSNMGDILMEVFNGFHRKIIHEWRIFQRRVSERFPDCFWDHPLAKTITYEEISRGNPSARAYVRSGIEPIREAKRDAQVMPTT